MEALKGLIFDIQGFSVHDGPGSRTLFFLSGCPLRCEWCANPEGLELRQRILFSPQKCKHEKNDCIRCIEACPNKAIKLTQDQEIPLTIEHAICKDCQVHACTEACYNEAIRLSGKWMAVSELIKVTKRDRTYWEGKEGGGVTFSGGEPFFQKEFLREALKKCKEVYIHTAIETTAYVPTEDFLEVMGYVDFAFIDLKHMNKEKHIEKTGIDNTLILENIKALAKSDWKGRVILRMPVIEDYNDGDKNIIEMAAFMNDVGLFEVNILPFHRMGDSKWKQLGKVYKYKDYEPTSIEKLEHIQDLFLDQKIACYVGSEVFY
ncbi:4-hydroxyphenylacetate decarboxylase activase [Clostridiaceae bacterium 35-E11]